jgi:hypothetical protein
MTENPFKVPFPRPKKPIGPPTGPIVSAGRPITPDPAKYVVDPGPAQRVRLRRDPSLLEEPAHDDAIPPPPDV